MVKVKDIVARFEEMLQRIAEKNDPIDITIRQSRA